MRPDDRPARPDVDAQARAPGPPPPPRPRSASPRAWHALALLPAALAACATSVGLAGAAPTARPAPPAAVPWPAGQPPDARALDAALDAAEERARLDRDLEFASAIENEQESFLVQVLQTRLEANFGLAETFDYGLRLFRDPMRASFGANGAHTVDEHGDSVARVHNDRGARDATACDGCHSVGGRDGAGSASQVSLSHGDGARLSSALPRNPPALLGVGVVAALAAEMTADLHAIRDQALREQRTLNLVTKGVSFGTIRPLSPDAVDLSGVVGLDADLVVRPLGWKGTFADLRAFCEDALLRHFGLQSVRAEQAADAADPDADGVLREVEEGSLTALTVYLAMLELPQVLPPGDPALRARWQRGGVQFEAIGCAGCHVPTLRLDQRIQAVRSPIDDTPGVRVHLLADGDGPKGTDQIALYSDLKRHDLGLADAHPHGAVPSTVWLTRPLWGLAASGPWLHDGRAATLDEAIAAHAGEAAPVTAAWSALTEDARADLRVWLMSLGRAPRLGVAR